MGTSDTFPVDPDYSVTRSKVANVLTTKLDSARTYFRQKAAPQRIFDLGFTRHSAADWASIENFRLKMLTDFFTFFDKTAQGIPGRKFSCFFNSEPTYEEAGNEQVNIKLQLIEAVGAALDTYPDFAHNYPSINKLVAAAQDLGGSGKQWIYAGYGFRVNGSYTAVLVDESDVTGALAGGVYIGVPLGLHRLRVTGGPPTSLDYLI